MREITIARAIALLWVLAGCDTESPVAPGVRLACETTEQCPPGQRCVEALGECLDPFSVEADCYEPAGDELVPASDGVACETAAGGGGVCVAAVCVPSRCGDGVFDATRELCDDGDDNPNDGCDACRTQRWEPEVVAGFGESGGDALALTTDAFEVAVGPRGALFVAGAARIWRVDPTTRFPTVWAGTGVLPANEGIAPASEGERATSVPLRFPAELHVDGAENVYFTDRRALWRICGPLTPGCPQGTLERIAGSGQVGTPVEGAAALEADFGTIRSVALGRLGDIFILNYDVGPPETTLSVHRVCKSGQDCVLDRVDTVFSYRADALNTPIRNVREMALDPSALETPQSITLGVEHYPEGYSGPVYSSVHRFRVGGAVESLADTQRIAGSTDGTGSLARDIAATGALLDGRLDSLGFDGNGNLLIAAAHRIERVCTGSGCTPGWIETLGGDGSDRSGPDGAVALSTGLRPVDLAPLNDGALVFANGERAREIRAGTVVTVLGDGARDPAGDFGAATSARLLYPVAIDWLPDGNLVIASFDRSRIRKWCVNDAGDCVAGTVRPFAGTGNAGHGGDDGPALAAELQPADVAVDDEGNVYLTDQPNHRVREVCATHCPKGTIRTVAGTGAPGTAGDGGPALAAELRFPRALAFSAQGDLLISSAGRVKRLCLSGEGCTVGYLDTVAGNGDDYSVDGVAATATGLGDVFSLAVDDAGNLFIGGDARVFEVCAGRADCAAGTLRRFAGTGEPGFSGDGASALDAQLNIVAALATDDDGDLFLADRENHRVRRLCRSGDGCALGTLDTVLGSGPVTPPGEPASSGGFGGDGGPALAAGLDEPHGLVFSDAGTLYVADAGNDLVRALDSAGRVVTVVGAVDPPGDGPVPLSEFIAPAALVPFGAGWLIADGVGGRVRALDNLGDEGWLRTVLGYPEGDAADGLARFMPVLLDARGLAVDPVGGRFFASDRGGQAIYAVSTAGEPWLVERFAGTGVRGFGVDGTPAAQLAVGGPSGLAYDVARDVLWVVERDNHILRTLSGDGLTSATRAGEPLRAGFDGDGGPAARALLNAPEAVALGPDGSVYFSDTGNHRVRRIDPAGFIHTVLGDGTPASGATGAPARNIPAAAPRALWLDSFGNLFVAASTAVYVVEAGADGVASGEDRARTIYGASPRERFPDAVTACLTGLHGVADDAVLVADRCARLLLRLTRTREPGPAGE